MPTSPCILIRQYTNQDKYHTLYHYWRFRQGGICHLPYDKPEVLLSPLGMRQLLTNPHKIFQYDIHYVWKMKLGSWMKRVAKKKAWLERMRTCTSSYKMSQRHLQQWFEQLEQSLDMSYCYCIQSCPIRRFHSDIGSICLMDNRTEVKYK